MAEQRQASEGMRTLVARAVKAAESLIMHKCGFASGTQNQIRRERNVRTKYADSTYTTILSAIAELEARAETAEGALRRAEKVCRRSVIWSSTYYSCTACCQVAKIGEEVPHAPTCPFAPLNPVDAETGGVA